MEIKSKETDVVYPAQTVVDCTMLVDESGQDGRRGLFGLGVLFVPRPDLAKLDTFVQRVLCEVPPDDKGGLKAENWPEDLCLDFCDLIHENRWGVQAPTRDLEHHDWHDKTGSVHHLKQQVLKKMEDEGWADGLAQTEVMSMRTIFDKYYAYFDMLYGAVDWFVNATADIGIAHRRIQMIADRKLSQKLHERLLCWALFVPMSKRFPQLERMQSHELRKAHVDYTESTDDTEPRLLVADAIAHWGLMLRLAEEGRMTAQRDYGAYFHRMFNGVGTWLFSGFDAVTNR